jgi:hypothetical protein
MRRVHVSADRCQSPRLSESDTNLGHNDVNITLVEHQLRINGQSCLSCFLFKSMKIITRLCVKVVEVTSRFQKSPPAPRLCSAYI